MVSCEFIHEYLSFGTHVHRVFYPQTGGGCECLKKAQEYPAGMYLRNPITEINAVGHSACPAARRSLTEVIALFEFDLAMGMVRQPPV